MWSDEEGLFFYSRRDITDLYWFILIYNETETSTDYTIWKPDGKRTSSRDMTHWMCPLTCPDAYRNNLRLQEHQEHPQSLIQWSALISLAIWWDMRKTSVKSEHKNTSNRSSPESYMVTNSDMLFFIRKKNSLYTQNMPKARMCYTAWRFTYSYICMFYMFHIWYI